MRETIHRSSGVRVVSKSDRCVARLIQSSVIWSLRAAEADQSQRRRHLFRLFRSFRAVFRSRFDILFCSLPVAATLHPELRSFLRYRKQCIYQQALDQKSWIECADSDFGGSRLRTMSTYDNLEQCIGGAV